jgi:hypothetical protein
MPMMRSRVDSTIPSRQPVHPTLIRTLTSRQAGIQSQSFAEVGCAAGWPSVSTTLAKFAAAEAGLRSDSGTQARLATAEPGSGWAGRNPRCCREATPLLREIIELCDG